MWCILSPGYSNGRTQDFPRLCFSISKVHQFLVVLTLSVCHYLCACIYFHLSFCEHVCHCICLSVSLHLHLSAHLFASLSLCLSVHWSASVCSLVCLCLSVCLTVWVSVHTMLGNSRVSFFHSWRICEARLKAEDSEATRPAPCLTALFAIFGNFGLILSIFGCFGVFLTISGHF